MEEFNLDKLFASLQNLYSHHQMMNLSVLASLPSLLLHQCHLIKLDQPFDLFDPFDRFDLFDLLSLVSWHFSRLL